jgi:hypothetical protein
MKKLLASLVSVLVLLPAQAASADILNLSPGVFPDDQLAALSSTGDPFAVGGGSAGTLHFAFSAHCSAANCFGLATTDISGYAMVSDPTLGEAQGHVCAYGHGSRTAAFEIVVEKGSGFLGSLGSLVLTVQDFGGEPPNGTVPDELSVFGGPACSGVFPFLGGGPVVQGNIVVKP